MGGGLCVAGDRVSGVGVGAVSITRAEFLAERKTMIGGSDASAVMNIGYGCRRRLVLQKRGTEPDYPLNETAAMKRGTTMEPIIAGIYAETTGRKIWEASGAVRDGENSFLAVHVDRLIHDLARLNDYGYLEIKCLGREMFQRVKRDGLPEDYILQVQHGLMCSGLQWGSYAVFWADGWELLWWDVPRDEAIITRLREQAIETWRMVENGPLPERLLPDDRRCASCEYRRSCQGEALLAMAGDAADYQHDPDPRLAQLAADYLEAQRVASEAGELKEDCKAALLEALKERPAVAVNGARILFRASERKGYVVGPSVVRQLRVYPA